jgi:hypothetical protein
MMEKYRLVEEYRGEGNDFVEEESSSEELRITHLGKPKNYISYAMSLFVSPCFCSCVTRALGLWCCVFLIFSHNV